MIFLVAFVHLHCQTLDPRLLVFISVCMSVIGLLVWKLLDPKGQQSDKEHADYHAKASKASILVFLALIALAPILRTLTAATSSDSIWALSVFLFILNAGLADYGSTTRGVRQTQERLTSVLSMNAAVSAAVVLASRLHGELSVFALVLFAVQLFALFPLLRHRLQSTRVGVRLAVTVTMAAFSLALMAYTSLISTLLFGAAMTSISFVAPAVLVRTQAYKNEIRGPWDVATPKVYSQHA